MIIDVLIHDIEHELSVFYDIPHGVGLAIVTPDLSIMEKIYGILIAH